MKIHIFGASGSGTTTLGRRLAQQINYKHLDADDYYWEKTDPPFQDKMPLDLRNEHIIRDFELNPFVIISGSMVSWGKQWESAFDLAVFLYIPHKIRMERLRKREMERYGDSLQKEEDALANSKAFLDWAAKYDDETFEGRSIGQHKAWIKRLECPVLKIEGDTTVDERVNLVVREIDKKQLSS
ncbi:AAA family ATPase [Fulvivirgaceae bacterium BMA10]|uniref:AAA family ATPase n=1 Tax=Splendidivirga corallicola TaxID=3051826 RepID=A0ABT8KQE0_9BACT|nr:AAA family ATPase [Fulvivirgaceae bacterium BMA10]